MSNKVSIIMPTYNDSNTIIRTLTSLLIQTYKNWELVIVNDGSTDNTATIINDFIDENHLSHKIKYLYQENQDQLNAIKNGLNYAKGEYLYILHSDDLLPNTVFLQNCVDFMDKHCNCDAIIGDYIIIDKNDNVTNIWKTPKYRKKRRIPGHVLLKNGGNIYGDVAFHRKKIYEKYVKANYLDWNTPFWLDFSENQVKMLNVCKMKFPILKYRLDGTNYNTNEIGKHNVLNGELRTMTNIMKYYNIPLFRLQQFFYNLFRRRYIRNLRLSPYIPLIYFNGEQKGKDQILDKAIKRVYPNGYSNNLWLSSLVTFYSKKSDRKIFVEEVKTEDVLIGSDLRKFTKLLFEGSLPKIYYMLFDEMKNGFNTIVVKSDKMKSNLEDIVKFLCIGNDVKVIIRKK